MAVFLDSLLLLRKFVNLSLLSFNLGGELLLLVAVRVIVELVIIFMDHMDWS